jgi:hypothetical protein
MVEITIPLVLDIIRTAGILVGIVYYITMLNNQSRAREAQFFWQLNQVFQEKEAINDWLSVIEMRFKDYDDFKENYDSSSGNSELYLQRSRVWRILNTCGHLLKRGLVSPETVYDSLSGALIVSLWENHGPIIRELRKDLDLPLHLEGMEYCAEAMKKVEESRLQNII